MPAEMQNLYAHLGVGEDVQTSELHLAFVRRAFADHSDQGGSQQSFKQTLRALEVLVEPEARRHYDQSRQSFGDHVLKLPAFTVVPGVGQAESLAFFQRLHSLLRQLPKEARRDAIMHRLNVTQRRDLESWMLMHRMELRVAGSNTSDEDGGKYLLSERSLCRHRVRGRSSGYRPTVHLIGGLYVNSAFTQDLRTALGTLGYLVVLRSFCRAAFQKLWSNYQSFEARLRTAIAEALESYAQSELPRLYFRVKLPAPGGKKQFSTPVRHDLTLAIADLRRIQDIRKILAGKRKAREHRKCGPHMCTPTREHQLLRLMDRLLQHTPATKRMQNDRVRKASPSACDLCRQTKRTKSIWRGKDLYNLRVRSAEEIMTA